MRPPPSDFIPSAYPPPRAALTTVRLPFQEPSLASLDACDHRPCRWTPSASDSHSPSSPDFEANAILVMIVLLCTVICVLALHAALRCFLRGGGGGSSSSQLSRPEPPITSSTSTESDGKHSVIRSPPVAYSATMGIAGAECAICLTEFEEGIGVRVLRRCRHGFHTDCIEKWLSSHLSCPNCRGSCFPPAESSPCKPSPEPLEASSENQGGHGSIGSELAASSD